MSRKLRFAAALASDEGGFTLIEVLAATVILVTGLLALFEMLDVASRVTTTNRVRQAGTSLAREVLEDARTLPHTQLVAGAIASALQPMVSPSTVLGSKLLVNRSVSGLGAPLAFSVSFTVCSLDDPSDGYGSHTGPPVSGGTWCPDISPSGTADTTPDDYERVDVTVTPTGARTTPSVQQTALIYAEDAHGPAATCLSTTTSCPGSNQLVTSGSSLVFNVATTVPANRIEWLVNGNLAPRNQIGTGGQDPYAPSGTTSQFTWVYPTAVANGRTQTIDGIYTITAVAFDANGHSGTRSSLQITVNEHDAIAPTNLVAGWNSQLQSSNGGGVDVQWAPSVDQDVLYYDVYRTGVATPVCQSVTGTSCTDLTAPSPNPPAVPAACSAFPGQSYATVENYWVVGVDIVGGSPRISSQQSNSMNANLCNHPPSPPISLTATPGNGSVTLSWTAALTDPDPGDSITGYRIYRWAVGTSGPKDPADRLNLTGSSATTFTDTAPDPGGTTQNYCVTAIDAHLDESTCSSTVSG